jgi:hypothetical protein
MHSDNPSVNLLKIRPTQVVVYNDYPYFKARSVGQRKNEKNLTRGQYNGFMSQKTKKKIGERVEVWVNGVNAILRRKRKASKNSKPYFTFVTLTLPSSQIHTDKEIKRHCLNKFIIWMTRSKEVKHYYWVAEKQKNGNIHFHIIVDKFIDWQELKKEWNSCINTLGYVNRYSDKMSKVSFSEYYNLRAHGYKGTQNQMSKTYITQKKSNWTQPNSTDIHKLIDLDNPAAYITKYLTKGNDEMAIDGRLSGCSDSLKDLKQSAFVIEGRFWHEIQRLKKDKRVKSHYDEYFGCFYLNKGVDLKTDYPYLYRKMLIDNVESMKKMYNNKELSIDEKVDVLLDREKKKEKEAVAQLNLFGKTELKNQTKTGQWRKDKQS